jgi:hypothetical protein
MTPAIPAAGRLTPQQIDFLLSGIRAERIGKDGKGFAHVEAWDIRRHLIRVFGFGGYSTDQQEMTLVAQIEHKPSNANGKSRWTVIYRATVVLTVKVNGIELGHWHGTAMGDAPNLPSLADAHDMAMKTADSQALKRAAVNLGDAFGLSLYNDGSLNPVVLRSLAHTAPTASAQPEQEDTPVRPEPQAAVPREEEPPTRVDPAPRPPAPATRPAPVPPGEDPEDRAAAHAEMKDAAAQVNFADGLPAQFQAAFGHPIEQGTTAEYRQARDLMLGQPAAA